MSEHPSTNRPPLRTLFETPGAEPLLFGITPPRQSATTEQAATIARVTMDRLADIDVDGLILYDIDDESDRNQAERPFPYLPTMDPTQFEATHLAALPYPIVIYRSVGKYTEPVLRSWLEAADANRVSAVFVGASSKQKAMRTSLTRSQELQHEVRPDMMLGGVAISERHTATGDEHHRLIAKQTRGCSFFVSQVVYDVAATKNMLSDYFYACTEARIDPRPVVLTLSVCGSLKTLAFLEWLGVDVPRWLQNSLAHATDPLTESYDQCMASAVDLAAFCRRLGMPFGFNIESVSNRKAEIEASVAIAHELRGVLR
ncbi:methylenetetrahydrofolate reductase [Kribbella sp. DT2]|uniref:methylenetetrahydrofolate reductase n=1 Tax=Kribbella sp. DT2 TaxID=3393427 RepID=UPI003CF8E84C